MATFGETPWALLLPGNCASNARIPVDGIGLTIGSGCVQDMTFGRHLPHLDLCMPNVEPSHCALTYERVDRVCVLHDLSESGTWLNGRRLGLGHAVDLRDGDVIALAPPAQGGQATGPVSFTFLYTHEQAQEVPVAEQQPGPAMRHKRSSAWLPHQRPNCPTRLQCGICSQALVQAVTMEPCSHSFCATCMSEHMGRQLQAGLAPRCPHRCSHPQQFVRANYLLRNLVQAAGPAIPGAAVCPSTTPDPLHRPPALRQGSPRRSSSGGSLGSGTSFLDVCTPDSVYDSSPGRRPLVQPEPGLGLPDSPGAPGQAAALSQGPASPSACLWPVLEALRADSNSLLLEEVLQQAASRAQQPDCIPAQPQAPVPPSLQPRHGVTWSGELVPGSTPGSDRVPTPSWLAMELDQPLPPPGPASAWDTAAGGPALPRLGGPAGRGQGGAAGPCAHHSHADLPCPLLSWQLGTDSSPTSSCPSSALALPAAALARQASTQSCGASPSPASSSHGYCTQAGWDPALTASAPWLTRAGGFAGFSTSPPPPRPNDSDGYSGFAVTGWACSPPSPPPSRSSPSSSCLTMTANDTYGAEQGQGRARSMVVGQGRSRPRPHPSPSHGSRGTAALPPLPFNGSNGWRFYVGSGPESDPTCPNPCSPSAPPTRCRHQPCHPGFNSDVYQAGCECASPPSFTSSTAPTHHFSVFSITAASSVSQVPSPSPAPQAPQGSPFALHAAHLVVAREAGLCSLGSSGMSGQHHSNASCLQPSKVEAHGQGQECSAGARGQAAGGCGGLLGGPQGLLPDQVVPAPQARPGVWPTAPPTAELADQQPPSHVRAERGGSLTAATQHGGMGSHGMRAAQHTTPPPGGCGDWTAEASSGPVPNALSPPPHEGAATPSSSCVPTTCSATWSRQPVQPSRGLPSAPPPPQSRAAQQVPLPTQLQPQQHWQQQEEQEEPEGHGQQWPWQLLRLAGPRQQRRSVALSGLGTSRSLLSAAASLISHSTSGPATPSAHARLAAARSLWSSSFGSSAGEGRRQQEQQGKGWGQQVSGAGSPKPSVSHPPHIAWMTQMVGQQWQLGSAQPAPGLAGPTRLQLPGQPGSKQGARIGSRGVRSGSWQSSASIRMARHYPRSLRVLSDGRAAAPAWTAATHPSQTQPCSCSSPLTGPTRPGSPRFPSARLPNRATTLSGAIGLRPSDSATEMGEQAAAADSQAASHARAEKAASSSMAAAELSALAVAAPQGKLEDQLVVATAGAAAVAVASASIGRSIGGSLNRGAKPRSRLGSQKGGPGSDDLLAGCSPKAQLLATARQLSNEGIEGERRGQAGQGEGRGEQEEEVGRGLGHSVARQTPPIPPAEGIRPLTHTQPTPEDEHLPATISCQVEASPSSQPFPLLPCPSHRPPAAARPLAPCQHTLTADPSPCTDPGPVLACNTGRQTLPSQFILAQLTCRGPTAAAAPSALFTSSAHSHVALGDRPAGPPAPAPAGQSRPLSVPGVWTVLSCSPASSSHSASPSPCHLRLPPSPWATDPALLPTAHPYHPPDLRPQPRPTLPHSTYPAQGGPNPRPAGAYGLPCSALEQEMPSRRLVQRSLGLLRQLDSYTAPSCCTPSCSSTHSLGTPLSRHSSGQECMDALSMQWGGWGEGSPAAAVLRPRRQAEGGAWPVLAAQPPPAPAPNAARIELERGGGSAQQLQDSWDCGRARAAVGHPSGGQEGSGSSKAEGQAMHPLVDLGDEQLPLHVANLKAQLLEDVSLGLRDAASTPAPLLPPGPLVAWLSCLARLCWADDESRQAMTASGAVHAVVACMGLHAGNSAVQMAGCMALMALVRGEGDVCLACQWHIAKVGGVEAVAAAMKLHTQDAGLQLAALACLVPLALENSMMQASCCYELLGQVVKVLDVHGADSCLQTKGLVLLGVMAQGNEAVLEPVRQLQLEAGVCGRVVTALQRYGEHTTEVLWAALFAASQLTVEGSCFRQQAASQLARHRGIRPLLSRCLAAYEERLALQQMPCDPSVAEAAQALTGLLEAAHQQRRQWQRQWQGAALIVLSAGVVLAAASRVSGWCWCPQAR